MIKMMETTRGKGRDGNDQTRFYVTEYNDVCFARDYKLGAGRIVAVIADTDFFPQPRSSWLENIKQFYLDNKGE